MDEKRYCHCGEPDCPNRAPAPTDTLRDAERRVIRAARDFVNLEDRGVAVQSITLRDALAKLEALRAGVPGPEPDIRSMSEILSDAKEREDNFNERMDHGSA